MEILSTSSVFTLTVIALITVILSKFFPANKRIGRTITWLASDSLLGPFLAILHPEKILGPVLAICLRITSIIIIQTRDIDGFHFAVNP